MGTSANKPEVAKLIEAAQHEIDLKSKAAALASEAADYLPHGTATEGIPRRIPQDRREQGHDGNRAGRDVNIPNH